MASRSELIWFVCKNTDIPEDKAENLMDEYSAEIRGLSDIESLKSSILSSKKFTIDDLDVFLGNLVSCDCQGGGTHFSSLNSIDQENLERDKDPDGYGIDPFPDELPED